MTTVATEPEMLATDYGLHEIYRHICDALPSVASAITRFLSVFDPSDEDVYALRFIEILHRLEGPAPTPESITHSVRSMVQGIVAFTPSDAPLAVQWADVRRSLISDDEALAAGLNPSFLDELP